MLIIMEYTFYVEYGMNLCNDLRQHILCKLTGPSVGVVCVLWAVVLVIYYPTVPFYNV